MTFSERYLTIPTIVEMTNQNQMTSLFGDHPGQLWASGHEMIPSRQHLENKSRQHNSILCQRTPCILSIGRSISFRRRSMNGSPWCWHPRWYPIKRLKGWILPLMCILTRGTIQTKLVSNWLHGKLEIYGDMSPLLTTWHASSSVQNRTPRQPFQAIRQWS